MIQEYELYYKDEKASLFCSCTSLQVSYEAWAWNGWLCVVYSLGCTNTYLLFKSTFILCWLCFFFIQGQRLQDTYRFQALITTYEIIISDMELLTQIDWRISIIDEAHRLKNRNCKLLEGLRAFNLVGGPLLSWCGATSVEGTTGVEVRTDY